MTARRIIVGQTAWALPDGDVGDLPKQIEAALGNSTVLQVEVLTDDNRPVTLFVNGRAAETVVLDLGRAPRPSETSG